MAPSPSLKINPYFKMIVPSHSKKLMKVTPVKSEAPDEDATQTDTPLRGGIP
jgi:hypothetical protein